MTTNTYPQTLTDQASQELWNQLHGMATDGAVELTHEEAQKYDLDLLAALGGCQLEETEKGMLVTLSFAEEEELDAEATEAPVEAASKPTDFAQDPEQRDEEESRRR